jgi:cAMP-dependent protein kinase regulator
VATDYQQQQQPQSYPFHHQQQQQAQQLELESYLTEKGVQQLLVKIVEKLLVDRPENPIEYLVNYLSENYPEQAGKHHHHHPNPVKPQHQQPLPQQPQHYQIPFLRGSENNDLDESMISDDETSFLAGSPVKALRPRTGTSLNTHSIREQRRGSVSAAPLTDEEKSVVPVVYPKSVDDVANLKEILPSYWVTSSLDEDQTTRLIAAMENVRFKKGEIIIQQGDERADHYYVMKKGQCKIVDNGVVVRQVQESEGFGELALLYNRPRCATVLAETDCELWRLDRTTFRVILVTSAIERRSRYVDFLSKIPLLSSLDDRARQSLADTLQMRQYKNDEVVVKQGDKGTEFFIIEKGTAEVLHNGEKVDVLREGDYFGEIALLDPTGIRAATVRASLDGLSVLCFRREVFTRILGPYLTQSLKKRIPSYRRTPTKKPLSEKQMSWQASTGNEAISTSKKEATTDKKQNQSTKQKRIQEKL